MADRRLRIARIMIQPEMVWDDGEEMTPGPEVNALSVSLSQAFDFLQSLPDQVAKLQDQAQQQEAELLQSGQDHVNPFAALAEASASSSEENDPGSQPA